VISTRVKYAAALLFCLPALSQLKAFSQVSVTPSAMPLDPALGITTIPLWNGVPPDSSGPVEAVPTLTVFLPQPGRGNGTAIVIAPGGAYRGLASNLEGRQVADWFTSRGVTAFVLRYRLGAQNLYPVPLEDGLHAVRVVRSLAAQYGFSPQRVGMAGFSAGGHLSAEVGTMFDEGNAAAADPVERLSSRPDFLVLGYPWLNAMQPNDRGFITYCSVIKVPAEQCKADEEKYTPSLHVTSRTPPTFIYSTTDDAVVPVSASVDFYNALHAAGVSVEMHLFRHGPHGSGLGSGDAALDAWTVLLEQWLREQGLLTPVAVVH
jgi:acetyl esterase/lipase